MPNANLTEIIFILDRSGSMAAIKRATEEGFSKFVEEQLHVPGEARMTLVQFDNVIETVYHCKPIKDLPKLVFEPRASTSLHDAIGFTITGVGKRLEKTPEEDRPGKVVVVIMTDGAENSSREYSGIQGARRIKEMIKHQIEKYSWNFIFLGANINAEQVAEDLGMFGSNAVQYSSDVRGTEAVMRGMGKGVGNYRGAQGREADLMLGNFKKRAMDKEDLAEIDAALSASGVDSSLLNNKDPK